MYTIRRGGAYDRFMMMLEAFLERGCEVHCLSLTPIQIENSFFHNHRPFFLSKCDGGFMAKVMVFVLFPMYILLIGWREKVDLIIAFSPIYAFLQVFPKLILRSSLITFIRSDLSLGTTERNFIDFLIYLNKFAQYVGLIFSDLIITTNRSGKKEVTKLIRRFKKIKVEILFNNIVETKKPTSEEVLMIRNHFGIPAEAKILVTAGIMTPGKNYQILLKCLSKIENKDLFLLLIGDSTLKRAFDYKDHLSELTKELNLSERVIMPGWVDREQLSKIFSAADLFVLPSLREGMPNVVLEALGSDLPCLGSNIAGIRDILHYEELMFDPLDEESIKIKISQAFSDVKLYQQIRNLCQERKKVFIFDWKERAFQLVINGIPDGNYMGKNKLNIARNLEEGENTTTMEQKNIPTDCGCLQRHGALRS